MSATPLSVYVHLPFCARKCHYCDFNSRPGSPAEMARYLDALKTEIDRRAATLGGCDVRTLFFGGGTPTVYEAGELAGVLGAVAGPRHRGPTLPVSAKDASQAGGGGKRTGRARKPARPDGGGTGSRPGRKPSVAGPTGFEPVGRSVEITCEANPETVDLPKLREMRQAGFNRISIGAQSFHDDELAMLGRGHTAGQTEDALRAARRAGFENVSLDLIYALPGQTVAAWRATLERALELEPDHLSAYGLELAEGTRLFECWQAGEIETVSESEHLAMREVTRELCEQAGLARYEISNYARPGCECRHNITYWRNEPYLGLGAGAWSYLDGVRSANVREPAAYADAVLSGDDPEDYAERLGPDDALAEALMMGLRLTEGIDLGMLEACYGPERVAGLRARAEPLAEMGLVEVAHGRLRLTRDGEPLHGEVVVRLT